MTSMLGNPDPEFVSTVELQRRDRLPGWYAIADEVTRAFVYEDRTAMIFVGHVTGIEVELSADLMDPYRHHSLIGAWVQCRGFVASYMDRRWLVATGFEVAEWPTHQSSPDPIDDPDDDQSER